MSKHVKIKPTDKNYFVGYEVLTAVTLSNPEEVRRRFGGRFCLRFMVEAQAKEDTSKK
jgi:hypothetical protein